MDPIVRTERQARPVFMQTACLASKPFSMALSVKQDKVKLDLYLVLEAA